MVIEKGDHLTWPLKDEQPPAPGPHKCLSPDKNLAFVYAHSLLFVLSGEYIHTYIDIQTHVDTRLVSNKGSKKNVILRHTPTVCSTCLSHPITCATKSRFEFHREAHRTPATFTLPKNKKKTLYGHDVGFSNALTHIHYVNGVFWWRISEGDIHIDLTDN